MDVCPLPLSIFPINSYPFFYFIVLMHIFRLSSKIILFHFLFSLFFPSSLHFCLSLFCPGYSHPISHFNLSVHISPFSSKLLFYFVLIPFLQLWLSFLFSCQFSFLRLFLLIIIYPLPNPFFCYYFPISCQFLSHFLFYLASAHFFPFFKIFLPPLHHVLLIFLDPFSWFVTFTIFSRQFSFFCFYFC